MHEEAFEETPVSSSKVEKFPARPAIEIQSEIISLATTTFQRTIIGQKNKMFDFSPWHMSVTCPESREILHPSIHPLTFSSNDIAIQIFSPFSSAKYPRSVPSLVMF